VQISAAAKPRRPAHRPSRRPVIVEGAMGLFATMPVEEVTVQDIAAAVDVTPAAVYYHFASKEQILIEGMEQFRSHLLETVRSRMPAQGDDEGIRHLVRDTLAWTARHRHEATVYYVNSIGLNLLVEALRRETRVELIELFRTAVRAVRSQTSAAEAGVIAVGLVSLLETAIASMVNQDAVYRGIGARRYIAEVAAIADSVVGIDL
jgi:AcrR family transcriptional regulator